MSFMLDDNYFYLMVSKMEPLQCQHKIFITSQILCKSTAFYQLETTTNITSQLRITDLYGVNPPLIDGFLS